MDAIDYVRVLDAIDEISFSTGRKLLVAYLQGDESNDSVRRNKLFLGRFFGALAYEDHELQELIDKLIQKGYIALSSVRGKPFIKTLILTEKGSQEIKNPNPTGFYGKNGLKTESTTPQTIITEEDKKRFTQFGPFLERYNDEQKKAIITPGKHILCIAGAGTGKTSVLTKRIEFLVRYCSVPQEKILAITFTRKARQEMKGRLEGMSAVSIQTFNSFCERIIQQHKTEMYQKEIRLIQYRDKILILQRALESLGKTLEQAIDIYFTFHQKRGKTNQELLNILMGDCFWLRDYVKLKNMTLSLSDFTFPPNQKVAAELLFGIANYITASMRKQGLYDYADQLVDTISFLQKNPDLVPGYDHILVDEYQDVNATQISLLSLLSPKNLFCVGDPRQSIYGWRGSDISYILDFATFYKDAEIISLIRNYRSQTEIVKLANASIASMKLPDLQAHQTETGSVRLFDFDQEQSELLFVADAIAQSSYDLSEVFVLSRTNRQLKELAQLLMQKKIPHQIRTEERAGKKIEESQTKGVTLATIHAIKGLEAEQVFVMGANGLYFPCKGTEHPVVELMKVEEYDKFDEERRLFYVALSRAKKELIVSYTGKKATPFITPAMKQMLSKEQTQLFKPATVAASPLARLEDWRSELADELGVKPYQILSDRTLLELAETSPATKEELYGISGMDPVKIVKYADVVLRLVK